MDDGWKVSSVESGSGSGQYKVNSKYDLSGDFERTFHGTVISGEQGSESETDWNETWTISYKIVDDELVRETEGEIVETYEMSSWYSCDGSASSNPADVVTEITGGTQTVHSEWNASISEEGKNSFKEVVTTNWSNKVDDNGELQFDTSAVAELTTKSEGNYSYYYFSKTTNEVETSYGDKFGWGSTVSCTSNTITIEVSEEYESELTETWEIELGDDAFSFVSMETTLSGSGDSFYETSYEVENNDYDACGSDDDDGCYSEYESDTTTVTTQTAAYSYDDNWDGTLSSIDNNITGQKEISSDSYWSYTYESHNDFTNCHYLSAGVSGTSESDSESSQYTEYEYDEDVQSIGFGDGFVSVYNHILYEQFTGNGAIISSYRDYITPAKTTYSPNNSAPINATNIDQNILENHYTNYLEFEDLTTGKPNFGNSVVEMPEPTGEKPIPPPPPNPGSNVNSSYKANPSDTWTVTEAFLAGLQIGGKAIVNGAASTIVSTVTIGQINNVELITVTETDRAYGYDYSFAAAQVATTSVVALATMGTGCAAAQGSRIAGVAVSSIQTLEAANAVNSIVTGTGNMIANGGVDLGNAVQVGTGLLGMGALKATACFTAGTQVVLDDETRDKVYFTETAVTQSYDEVNILFTLAGLSSAFAATTITLKKRKSNKPIPSIPKKIDQIDEGLLCEIDETKRTFSLQKLLMVPLLIIATIICGYFALPTTRTVAVTKSVEQVKEGYITKNIEDIKIDDEVFAYNILTGKVSKCKVTDVFKRTSDHLRYLTVRDSKGTQILETTDSHPFWVVTDSPDLSRAARDVVEENGATLYHENIAITEHGYYVEAKDLKVGDIFLGANNELSILASTERVEFPEGIPVYNFTVDDNHNYFVIVRVAESGQTCVLVHNALYTDNGKLIRNGSLAGKKHPQTDVPFDDKGFPIFQVNKEVKIKYTGNREKDFAAANKEAGFKTTPEGMTWHHYQDGTTMQLVDKYIHGKTDHTGGFSMQ
jgi:hypothetical protein